MTKTKNLATMALLVAMTAVATMIIKIPTPATRGYVNVGDSVIFVSALLFGARMGGVSGGVGSALADVLLGYTHYAPITLVVKGIEGLIVGGLFGWTRRSLTTKSGAAVAIPIVLLGGAWMIAGYFTAQIYMYGLGAAIGELFGNTFQALLSAAIGIPIAVALRKAGL
ncbi:MAG: ECF transporter S component [Candidatus Latescibacterota bacterium]